MDREDHADNHVPLYNSIDWCTSVTWYMSCIMYLFVAESIHLLFVLHTVVAVQRLAGDLHHLEMDFGMLLLCLADCVRC